MSACQLPNLIIAGVHKAGTTALYSYLAKHPEVCASPKKEINFFTALLRGDSLPPLEDYGEYFGLCQGERYRLEASPSYLYGKEAIASEIRRCLPGARIIIILRDPVDRLLSFFGRAVANSDLPQDLGFEKYFELSLEQKDSPSRNLYSRGVREGLYIDYIQPWQEIFGNDLDIVFFEDLKNGAHELVTGICRWLGLDSGSYRAEDFTVENKTIHYRHKHLHRRIARLYMQTETFWRRHERVKKAIRTIYNELNATRNGGSSSKDAAVLSKVGSYYAPYNTKLRIFLEQNGYKNLPDWLTAG